MSDDARDLYKGFVLLIPCQFIHTAKLFNMILTHEKGLYQHLFLRGV